MTKTWILVANAAHASVYQTENLRTHDAQLFKELEHPDSRKKSIDLVSDRPGHFKTDSGARGAFDKGDPKGQEFENFAIELAEEIKKGKVDGLFEKLVVVAAAPFYALLQKHLPKNIDVIHIAKDYTQYSLADLNKSVKAHLEI